MQHNSTYILSTIEYIWRIGKSARGNIEFGTMGAGTLVHSFGSMYQSPMIPIYLRNGKGNGGKIFEGGREGWNVKWMVYEAVAIISIKQ